MRAPAEFKSETEEKEMIEFRKTLENEKAIRSSESPREVEKEKEDLISKAMAEGKFTELPPADITKITDYQRSVVNIEPAGWDRLRTIDEVDRETAFEIYGDAYTEQGELINESEMELLDPNGVMPKRRESKGKPEERLKNQYDKLVARRIGGGIVASEEEAWAKRLLDKITKAIGKDIPISAWNKLKKDARDFSNKYRSSEFKPVTFMDEFVKKIPETFDTIRRRTVDMLSKQMLKGTKYEGSVKEIKALAKQISEALGAAHETDHILNISAKQVGEDGALTDIYEAERALTIPGNLIPVLREVHKIKNRFEKHNQGAAPYLSMAELSSDPKFENQEKIDGITQQEAEAVGLYRQTLIDGINALGAEPSLGQIQQAYQDAANAFYKKDGSRYINRCYAV